MYSVDIIIPVFNEEKTIEALLEVVENTDFCGLKKNIIIVDDCSTDLTGEILKKYDALYKIIRLGKNEGKGAAVSTGIKAGTGDIVVIQDADLEYNPSDYSKLINLIIAGNSDVVFGSRFLNNSYKNFMPLSFIANKFLTFLTNLLFFTRLTDMETCYKAIRREFLANIEIKSKKFDLEPELTAKLIKKGAKINELPISYKSRNYQKGKKITAKDALMAVFALFKYRFFD